MFTKEKCARCGGTRTLQIHHINHDPSDNSPGNVQILCSTCHGRESSMVRWEGHSSICENCRQPLKRARQTTCSPSCGNEPGRRTLASLEREDGRRRRWTQASSSPE